ncbi:hypothetical protein K7X08_005718 [Anisodus acutangulus]|uniref:Uncharacterized protein n=1 Tax=Anisodus acutangulus TaxID=402998 RepID=A0A9Q1LTX6_9SOLA|nr:hypothetical protein K7X08_005718 [Anisodus acutangulus]
MRTRGKNHQADMDNDRQLPDVDMNVANVDRTNIVQSTNTGHQALPAGGVQNQDYHSEEPNNDLELVEHHVDDISDKEVEKYMDNIAHLPDVNTDVANVDRTNIGQPTNIG